MKEKEFLAYEKGFEDGYAMARRLYEPYCVEVTTKSGLPVKKLLKSTPPNEYLGVIKYIKSIAKDTPKK